MGRKFYVSDSFGMYLFLVLRIVSECTSVATPIGPAEPRSTGLGEKVP